jgi:uncharacterized protein (DUF302 family)
MDTWGRRLVIDMNFLDAVEKVSTEFQRQGFEISGQLDVRDNLARTLGKDFRRYTIMTFWHPVLGEQALQQSLEVGTELLVNVVVYELADQESVVAVADALPSLAGDLLWRDSWPALQPIEAAFDESVGRALGRLPNRQVPAFVM